MQYPAVRVAPLFLVGAFDLAADGTLVYMPGGGGELQRTLIWIDRKGTLTRGRSLRPYMHPRPLPDEQSVVIEIEDTPHNIWHYDLVTGALLVAAFPAGLRKQVSTNGGEMPMFSHDGRELFFRHSDRIMAAPFVSQPALSVAAPRVAFEVPPAAARINTGLPNYAVNRKGDAVLAVRNADEDAHRARSRSWSIG